MNIGQDDRVEEEGRRGLGGLDRYNRAREGKGVWYERVKELGMDRGWNG